MLSYISNYITSLIFTKQIDYDDDYMIINKSDLDIFKEKNFKNKKLKKKKKMSNKEKKKEFNRRYNILNANQIQRLSSNKLNLDDMIII